MMKPLSKFLTTIVGLAMTAALANAQTHYDNFLARSEAQEFNTSVFTLPSAAPIAVQTIMGKPAINVEIDVNAVFTLPDFQIEIPGLETHYAVMERLTENAFGGENWIGDVIFLDPTGFSTGIQGRAYFVEGTTGITGTIHTAESVLQIYPDGAGGHLLVSEDPSTFDREGEILSAVDLGEEVAASPLIGGRRDGPNVATPANPYTIDVLWVTTPLARESGADMAALVELATTTGNDVLINSEIPAQLRVVAIHDNTTYTEDASDMRQTLYDLRSSTDGLMDEIHQMRTDLGADLVSAVSGATNYCGIAYLDSTYSLGFSVNGRGCMSSYTPIHEFGHNFGAHHDTLNGTNYDYPFGYGLFNNTVDPYWRTVMSYQCPQGPSGYCSRIPYFSNSQQTYNDLPLGDEEVHDNARVLRVRIAEVASFAPSLTSSCTEHTSTNSTHVNEGRAYTETVWFTTRYYAVGSDEQISGYSFSTTTLAEEPAGYFTPGNCGTTVTESAFAPELQNFVVTPISLGLQIEGEVFDANADSIVAVRARETDVGSWTESTIDNGSFNVAFFAELSGNTSIDFQTEDANGDIFEFTTTFDIDIGEAPVLSLNSSRVVENTVSVFGESIDPDNEVELLFYQIDGAGDPEQGDWTSYPVESSYWEVSVSDLSTGSHTIHIYGEDQTAQRSNVLTVDFEVLPPQAPECIFGGASASISQNQGEVDIVGIAYDANSSDIALEARVNFGPWIELGSLSSSSNRNAWYYRLPEAYADGTYLSIDVRATDLSGMQTDCGTQIITIDYPSENLAPSCEIFDIFQGDGLIRFFMSASDPNGNFNQVYGKTVEMTEWIQTWPGPITSNGVPIPGFGETTVQGRVVDVDGLEGHCEATYTVVDESRAPVVEYASGAYDIENDTVIGQTTVRDDDGDIFTVEFREAGSPIWLTATKDPEDVWQRRWTVDLGLLENGQYFYEARALDAGGRYSEIYTFEMNIEREEPPTIDSLTYQLFSRTLVVQGTMYDPNNNARYVWYKLDDQEWQSFWESDPEFEIRIFDLTNGDHTLEVYVEDTYNLRSESQFINFNIDSGEAPVITSATFEQLPNTVVFHVTADDVDGDDLTLHVTVDGVSRGSYVNGTYEWDVIIAPLTVGSHTATFEAIDEFNNRSDIYTLDFEIIEQTPCFEDTNANHEAAGRAYSEEECSFEFFGICYGTITTTWYANGSDDNMGTSGSTVNSLRETSEGYYELGACNDTTPPVITLNGANPLTVYQGQTYQELGATAEDNIDGTFTVTDISGDVDTSIIGSYIVTYRATDSSGNSAVPVTRTVNVVADDVKPEITIPTGLTYEVVLNDPFSNPSAQATDNVDGDISMNVVVTGSVDTATVGTYYLYYNVTDAAGNAADEVVVTVEVVDEPISTCVTSTLTEHVNAGRAYEQYFSYYATGTATYLGSTFNDPDKVISLEETSPGNWSEVSSCN
ncbi:MAG: DUF5011 domain-containing protein [Agarilytica sp.]